MQRLGSAGIQVNYCRFASVEADWLVFCQRGSQVWQNPRLLNPEYRNGFLSSATLCTETQDPAMSTYLKRKKQMVDKCICWVLYICRTVQYQALSLHFISFLPPFSFLVSSFSTPPSSLNLHAWALSHKSLIFVFTHLVNHKTIYIL